MILKVGGAVPELLVKGGQVGLDSSDEPNDSTIAYRLALP